MADLFIGRLARVLVDYGAEVHAGDLVSIRSELAGAPLVREIYREVVRAGAFPVCRLALPDERELFLREAPDDLLRHCPEYLLREASAFDASIAVMAAENTQQLAGVDPAREAIHRQALRSVTEAYWKRLSPSSEHPLRWTLALYPTNALAQDARMSLAAFESFVWRACFLDRDDPVSAWRALGSVQADLIAAVRPAREVRLLADGTDLRLGVDGRAWINDDGRKNMPGGEFFTSPLEESVQGHVRFASPACIFGRRVEGVELTIKDGRVEHYSARHNGEFLAHMLGLDPGARYVGELAFGNNPNVDRLTGNVLFDEKAAGTVHLAIGASIPDCGGRNRSALHWDMVCDLRQGGEVYVDGELFQRDGRFI